MEQKRNSEQITDLDITNAGIRRGLWVIEGYNPTRDALFSPNKTIRMTNDDIMEEAIKRGLFVISDV